MREPQRFGTNGDRSKAGSLLSVTAAKIAALLRGGGLLLAPSPGGWAVLAHPGNRHVSGHEDSRVLLCASLAQAQSVAQLTLAETRVLEALTPGPLVVEAQRSEGTALRVGVPDSSDLRQIADALGGPLAAIGPVVGQSRDKAAANRDALVAASATHPLVGDVLGPDGLAPPTVVRITGPGDVEQLSDGALPLVDVVAASERVSQWEIEDWT